jgi:hypothetical protein
MALKKASAKFEGFETEHLMCRVLTHPFVLRNTYIGKRARTDIMELHVVCETCGCKKIVPIALSSAERLRAAYLHPPGYVKSKIKDTYGSQAAFREGVRLELMNRLMGMALPLDGIEE